MNVDANYIKELNDKVARYNMERQKQLGIVEAARQSFERGLSTYNSTYNTQLTAETLQDELNRVSESIENEAKELEKMITVIETGAYKEAKPTPTVVSVTATDGTLLTNKPVMPSDGVVTSQVSGVGVAGQNATQGVSAPSPAVGVTSSPSPAVGVAPSPAVGVTSSPSPAVGVAPTSSAPVSSATSPAPTPVPITSAPTSPAASPAPTPASPFGAPIQSSENSGIATPSWANSPTSSINNQFAEMLGGKFNPTA